MVATFINIVAVILLEFRAYWKFLTNVAEALTIVASGKNQLDAKESSLNFILKIYLSFCTQWENN